MCVMTCVSHGGGATQLLLGGGAAQLIKAENSPKPVTVKAEIKIKIDSGAMANSVAHDNCTPILRGLVLKYVTR